MEHLGLMQASWSVLGCHFGPHFGPLFGPKPAKSRSQLICFGPLGSKERSKSLSRGVLGVSASKMRFGTNFDTVLGPILETLDL